MKSFIFCVNMLLMCMAATITLAMTLPTNSGQDEKEGTKTVDQIIEELARRPEYQGPLDVPSAVGAPDEDTAEIHIGTAEIGTKRVKRAINNFDGYLYYICPWGQSISGMHSYHSNHHEDRRFNINCKPTFSSQPSCSRTHYVNSFDQPFDFTCPHNNVLGGIFSYHNNHHEDRRYSFYCCSGSGFHYRGCYWTGYVNNFDQPVNYNVPNNCYIAGMSSYHSNHHEDRRFRFYICYK